MRTGRPRGRWNRVMNANGLYAALCRHGIIASRKTREHHGMSFNEFNDEHIERNMVIMMQNYATFRGRDCIDTTVIYRSCTKPFRIRYQDRMWITWDGKRVEFDFDNAKDYTKDE